MILKNDLSRYKVQGLRLKRQDPIRKNYIGLLLVAFSLFLVFFSSLGCSIYKFTEAGTMPPEVKTVKVQYIENRAQYINTQLSQQLTETLKTKIIGTTRLKQTNDDDAHYDIAGYVSQYYTSTVNIANNNSTTNRLTVGFHLVFKNTLDPSKNFEADINRNEDFDANKSLTEAENTLTPIVVKNVVDEIFNKIFSNW